MSALGWQDAVVALLVVCALGYLVRRNVRARRSTAACSSCEGCAATPVSPAAQDAGEPLVNIGIGASRTPR